MTENQKKSIKNAVVTFIRAVIPPTIALISAVLTTLFSGNDAIMGTVVGTITGTIANGLC